MAEYESEKQTRRKRIDPLLKAAGWKIVPFVEHTPLSDYELCAVTEFKTDAGPADYALVVDGKIHGIVEAKKVSLGPQGVLVQAERYSKGASVNPMNYRGFHVPFLYSTNGEILWFHDVRHPLNRSRQVAGFHTPDALLELMERDFEAALDSLASLPFSNPMLRPYQKDANQKVEQAIAERKRVFLVAQATGTGKTLETVSQIYRLMKSGVAKRVLFLVDRRALAAQAVRAFASYDAEPNLKFDKIYEMYSQRFQTGDFGDDEKFDSKVMPNSYLTAPKPGLAFVYVSTIQRMTINLFGRASMFSTGDDETTDDDADKLDIPIHAFDLIVADECHRGYSTRELSVWRNTLDHFDAIKIGLTATPAAHTLAYFKEIVARYDYTQAVADGFLVDYNAVNIHSDIRLKGMFLEAGEGVETIDPATGAKKYDTLEDEREIETGEIERKATAPDSNRKILLELKKYADEHEQTYGRFPKTLIFAVNDLPHTSHSDALVDMARDIFGRGDSFVQKITGRVDRPLQRIREFRNRQEPGVVTTVDMLSTGVDIPDLEYIVFLRPVKSRILFEQMVGRGTRRGVHHPDKSHFTVFDCFGGSLLEYFAKSTGITAEPPLKESRSIIEIIDDIWANKDRDYNTRSLAKRLHRINKEMSGNARELFAAYVEDGDLGKLATELPRRLHDDFAGTMNILRNPAFQDLLLNYPRPERTFIVAYGEQDTVTSERLIKGADGKTYKPEDYLVAFEKFIKDNPEKIDAIGILLNRPQDWKTDALVELRQKMKASELHFTEPALQQAHQMQYGKALVEIISMVKHAAKEQEPLLTAKERVERAIAQATKGRTFTDEQRQWLDRIQNHLVQNLSIDKDDFEFIPIFANYGGWNRADRVFDGELDNLINELNKAIAA